MYPQMLLVCYPFFDTSKHAYTHSHSQAHSHSHSQAHSHSHSQTHSHTYTHTSIHTLTLTHIHTLARIHTHTHTHPHTYTLTHIHTHTHTHTHTHRHTHTHKHTHTHTHTHKPFRPVAAQACEALWATSSIKPQAEVTSLEVGVAPPMPVAGHTQKAHSHHLPSTTATALCLSCWAVGRWGGTMVEGPAGGAAQRQRWRAKCARWKGGRSSQARE
jgi:hypothetical protein